MHLLEDVQHDQPKVKLLLQRLWFLMKLSDKKDMKEKDWWETSE